MYLTQTDYSSSPRKGLYGRRKRWGSTNGSTTHLGKQSLQVLARLLRADERLDAAEEAASRAISLISDKGEQLTVPECYCILGDIYYSKGDVEKGINHLETALRIATPFSWHGLSTAAVRLPVHRRKPGVGSGRYPTRNAERISIP